MFDLYYKLIRVVERHEWEDFAAALRKPLPVTFRFVVDNVTPAFRAEGEAILERWAALKNGTRRLGRVDGWQLQLDKHELRQAEAGSGGGIARVAHPRHRRRDACPAGSRLDAARYADRRATQRHRARHVRVAGE